MTDFDIPKGVKDEAARGIEWVAEFDRGGTSVGRTTARKLINQSSATEDFVRKIAQYFPRHEVDKKAEGFKPGESGYPSNGRIAWALWGGDAGQTWSSSVVERLNNQEKDMTNYSNSIEKKNLKLSVKFLDDIADSETYEFEAIATTFGNIDREGDVIVAGAFNDGLQKVTPKLLWQHNTREPLGTVSSVISTEEKISFKGSMPKEDRFVAERVMPQMKHGSLDVSIGFMVEEQDYIMNESEMTRMIKKGTIYEISLVSIPANPQATITSVKSAVPYQNLPLSENSVRWDSSAAISRVREFTGSEDAPSETYRDAFLWSDFDNSDDFEAYKLPIADVVDNKLVAVPRAIFAAAAVMRGGRGGVDIPDNDRAAVVANINKYYEKMGRESPFEKGFSPDEIKTLSHGALVKFLRSRPLLSKSGAEMIAFKLVSGADRPTRQKAADDLQYLKSTLKSLEKD